MSAKTIRDGVRLRSGDRCEARVECSGARSVLFHHRKRAGRVDSHENLLHICDACHKWIHDWPATSYGLGLLVHSWDHPEEILVASASQRAAFAACRPAASLAGEHAS